MLGHRNGYVFICSPELEPFKGKLWNEAVCPPSEEVAFRAFRSELLNHASGLCPQGAAGIIPLDALQTEKKLFAFDMDSTLIQNEIIDEIAREAGVHKAVAAITERAMRGELIFEESLKLRSTMFRGLREEQIKSILARIRITTGAVELISILKKCGAYTAILSGGFSFAAALVKGELGIDIAYSNHLERSENGELSGRVLEPVLGAKTKADLLKQLVNQRGLLMSQTVAVGDGANDIPMLRAAGIGVAFNAKPALKEWADFWIWGPSLLPVSLLLGDALFQSKK